MFCLIRADGRREDVVLYKVGDMITFKYPSERSVTMRGLMRKIDDKGMVTIEDIERKIGNHYEYIGGSIRAMVSSLAEVGKNGKICYLAVMDLDMMVRSVVVENKKGERLNLEIGDTISISYEEKEYRVHVKGRLAKVSAEVLVMEDVVFKTVLKIGAKNTIKSGYFVVKLNQDKLKLYRNRSPYNIRVVYGF